MLLPNSQIHEIPLTEVLEEIAVRFIVNCPCEDLATSERFCFQLEEAHWFYADFVRSNGKHARRPSMKLPQFVKQLYEAVPGLAAINKNPEAALAVFRRYKNRIPVRGSIILNEDMSKVLLIRAWKGNSWGFPKGKINKEESDEQCAIRETFEEVGFDITPYLVKDDYIEVTIQGKNIRLYIVRGVPTSTTFETHTRCEVSKISWHSVDSLPGPRSSSAKTRNSYLIDPFMPALHRYIDRLRQQQGHLQHLAHESAMLKELMGILPRDGLVSNLASFGAPSLAPASVTSVALHAEPSGASQTLGGDEQARRALLNLLGVGRPLAGTDLPTQRAILEAQLRSVQAQLEELTLLELAQNESAFREEFTVSTPFEEQELLGNECVDEDEDEGEGGNAEEPTKIELHMAPQPLEPTNGAWKLLLEAATLRSGRGRGDLISALSTATTPEKTAPTTAASASLMALLGQKPRRAHEQRPPSGLGGPPHTQSLLDLLKPPADRPEPDTAPDSAGGSVKLRADLPEHSCGARLLAMLAAHVPPTSAAEERPGSVDVNVDVNDGQFGSVQGKILNSSSDDADDASAASGSGEELPPEVPHGIDLVKLLQPEQVAPRVTQPAADSSETAGKDKNVRPAAAYGTAALLDLLQP